MRKIIVPLAVFVLVAGYQGYRMLSHGKAPAAKAEGVTGATIKQPAVNNPDVVDFGRTVNSLDDYSLQASEAGKDQPVNNPDSVRDQQIDAIVNKITSDDSAAQNAPAAAHVPLRHLSPAAVPTAPERTQSSIAPAGNGTTGATSKPKPEKTDAEKPEPEKAKASSEITDTDTLQGLPAPISTAHNTEALDSALKAYESPIVPRPRWRREHEAAVAGRPTPPQLPRGF